MATEQRMPFPGVPPKDHGPSQKDIDAANAGQLAPKGAEKFIQRLAKSTAVRLGLTVGAGYWAYEAVPAVHQKVDENLNNLSAVPAIGFDIFTQSPDSFDPKWKGTRLTSRNTVSVPASEQHAAQYDLSSNTMTIPVPLEIKTGMGVIIKRENKNAPALAFNNIPNGTIVYAPIDGRFSMETYPNKNASGQIQFLDEKGRMHLLLFYMGDAKAISSAYEIKTPGGKVTPENNPWNPNIGIPVKAGIPLFTINSGQITINEGAQLSIHVSPAVSNPDGTPLFEKNSRYPVAQSIDLYIKTTTDKAGFLKPQ